MSMNRKNIIRNYTIVEVMVAMGIFLIMMTIMMQFFTSAQKVWNASAKRNMIYADARVAMNLMTREIQCMLFENNDTDGSDKYPFWLEWQDITDCVNSYDETINPGNADYTEKIPSEFKDYFETEKELFIQTGGIKANELYVNIINFITTTDLKVVDEGSDVCEVKYRFIPIYCTSDTPNSVNDIKGGKLQRSCTSEYTLNSSGNSELTNTFDSTNTPYDYADFPLLASGDTGYQADRVVKIWEDNSSLPYKTVINGVYSLRFSCYKWVSGSGLKLLKEMNTSGKYIDDAIIDDDSNSTADYTLATGTPCPLAVRIDMKLMDPKDLKKLALNIYLAQKGDKEAEKQVKALKQKIRTFSKVIYLGKK